MTFKPITLDQFRDYRSPLSIDFNPRVYGTGFEAPPPADPLFGSFNEQGMAVTHTVEFPCPTLVEGPRAHGTFKRATAAERKAKVQVRINDAIQLSYGTAGGEAWVQAVRDLRGSPVRGPAVHYRHGDTRDRERAERESIAAFSKEFAHVEAGAAIAGTYAAGATAETITPAMCRDCGHAILLHNDYWGCDYLNHDDRLCGCLNGCKLPLSKPTPEELSELKFCTCGQTERNCRCLKFTPCKYPMRTEAVRAAVAEGENVRRVAEKMDELRIKEGFVVAQKSGVQLELRKLGCPDDIGLMIVKGITFTEKGDPAMLGKWAYIAGPMRGFPDFNFPAFDAAKAGLLANGFSVISPADVDRADEGPPDPIARTRLYVMRDFWTLYLLSTWGEGDAAQFICFLDGWQCSTGATAEALLARWLSLRPLCIDGKLPSPITERPWGNVMRDFATPATV